MKKLIAGSPSYIEDSAGQVTFITGVQSSTADKIILQSVEGFLELKVSDIDKANSVPVIVGNTGNEIAKEIAPSFFFDGINIGTSFLWSPLMSTNNAIAGANIAVNSTLIYVTPFRFDVNMKMNRVACALNVGTAGPANQVYWGICELDYNSSFSNDLLPSKVVFSAVSPAVTGTYTLPFDSSILRKGKIYGFFWQTNHTTAVDVLGFSATSSKAVYGGAKNVPGFSIHTLRQLVPVPSFDTSRTDFSEFEFSSRNGALGGTQVPSLFFKYE